MGARERILEMVNAAWTTQAIGTACELGLPDLLAPAPSSSAEIAAVAGADPDAVHRLLRALASLGLTEEREEGVFALTAEGALLSRSAPQSLGAWAAMNARRMWANWGELGHSVRTGRSARLRLQGVDDFSFLERDPAAALQFHHAMVELSRPVAVAAARTLDWSGTRTLVDVGGGAGALAATILAHHRHLEGIVLDLPHALDAARAQFRAAGVEGRCEARAGDFFAAVPNGADTYLLKSVLHDWDDTRALAILERCAEAMAPGARVVVLERIVPERLSSSPVDRDIARSDLNMLVGCGGRERTQRQFRALLGAAGLRVASVTPLTADFSALVAER